MEVNARNHETPDVLPWIPPGQSIEETTNKFAHKKGSIASKINAEVAAKKKSILSPSKKKKDSTFSTLSKGSSDSGIDSANDLSQSLKRNLKGEILQIFDEDENDYDGGRDRRRFVESNFEMEDRKVRIEERRPRKEDPRETDSDSDNEEDRRRLAKRSVEFRTKMNDFLRNQGKFQRMENITTPGLGGQGQGLDSLEFYDDDYDRRKQSLERQEKGNQSNRSSYRNLDNSSISPRTNFTESFASRPSRLERIPEAWLVFPEDGLGGDNNRHSHSRLSNNTRAIPVNLRNAIGSRLQESFNSINKLKSTSDTPVENLVSTDKQRLTEDDDDDQGLCSPSRPNSIILWSVLAFLAVLIIVGIIVGVVYGVTRSDARSLELSGLEAGPGDNSPCGNYTTLTESWRRIALDNGPRVSGLHCDSALQDNWYRFEGDAGTQLADQRDPQKWESCGTSRVAWLRGLHPGISEGTVSRTVCVGEITGDCGHDSTALVRTCPDTRGGTFWVYRLEPVNVGCHWAFCTYTESDVPTS